MYYKFNYSKQRIQRIFDFIDYYVNFEKTEIKRKFEQEANFIFKNPQPMGIREAIVEDIKRQIREQVTEELTAQTAKKLEEQQKNTILKLRAKGMSDEEIADILSLSAEKIIYLTTNT